MAADDGHARRRRLAIGGLILFVILYAGLLVLYAVTGKTKEVHAEIPADGVRVTLSANYVDGEGQRLLLDCRPRSRRLAAAPRGSRWPSRSRSSSTHPAAAAR